jgi:hypothetical protein
MKGPAPRTEFSIEEENLDQPNAMSLPRWLLMEQAVARLYKPVHPSATTHGNTLPLLPPTHDKDQPKP